MFRICTLLSIWKICREVPPEIQLYHDETCGQFEPTCFVLFTLENSIEAAKFLGG